jgi:hypothetical protein
MLSAIFIASSFAFLAALSSSFVVLFIAFDTPFVTDLILNPSRLKNEVLNKQIIAINTINKDKKLKKCIIL